MWLTITSMNIGYDWVHTVTIEKTSHSTTQQTSNDAHHLVSKKNAQNNVIVNIYELAPLSVIPDECYVVFDFSATDLTNIKVYTEKELANIDIWDRVRNQTPKNDQVKLVVEEPGRITSTIYLKSVNDPNKYSFPDFIPPSRTVFRTLTLS